MQVIEIRMKYELPFDLTCRAFSTDLPKVLKTITWKRLFLGAIFLLKASSELVFLSPKSDKAALVFPGIDSGCLKTHFKSKKSEKNLH